MQPGFPTPNQPTTNPGAVPPVPLMPGIVQIDGGIIRPTACHHPSPPVVIPPPDIRCPRDSETQEDRIRALAATCGCPPHFFAYMRKFVPPGSILSSFHSYLSRERTSSDPPFNLPHSKWMSGNLYVHLAQEWGDAFKYLCNCYELCIKINDEMVQLLRGIAGTQKKNEEQGRNAVAQPNTVMDADVAVTNQEAETTGEQPVAEDITMDDGPKETEEQPLEIDESSKELEQAGDLEILEIDEAESTPGLVIVEEPTTEEAAEEPHVIVENQEEDNEIEKSEEIPKAQVGPETAEESREEEETSESAIVPKPIDDCPVDDRIPTPIETSAELSIIMQEDAPSPESVGLSDGEDAAQEDVPPRTPIVPVASMSMATMKKLEQISIKVPVTLFSNGSGSICIHLNQCKDRRIDYPTPSQACSLSSAASPRSQGSSKRSATQMEQAETQMHPRKTQRMWSWDGQSSLVEVIEEGKRAKNQNGQETNENGRRDSQNFMKEWFNSHQ